MLVHYERLSEILSKRGFQFAYSEPKNGGSVFSRTSAVTGIVEYVVSNIRPSPSGDKASCYVKISIVSGRLMVGEERIVTEFPGISKYGFMLLRSRGDAELWEERVGEIAPQRAREFALSEGPALLDRTAAARNAAAAYLSQIRAPGATTEFLQKMERLATTKQKALADAIAMRHGGGAPAIVAALSIVLFADTVEPGGGLPVDADPPQHAELTWRMRILLGALATERL